MSDCSTHTMEPGERRTCGTCAHCEPSEWHCDSKESEYSWMVDVDDVDLPCGGYGYERRTDGLAERNERTWTEPFEAYMPNGERVASFAGYSLEEAYSILVRHEHLAQVAREMYSTLGDALEVLSTVRIPRQNDKTSFSLHTLKCAERYISFHDELEALGVKLDGD